MKFTSFDTKILEDFIKNTTFLLLLHLLEIEHKKSLKKKKENNSFKGVSGVLVDYSYPNPSKKSKLCISLPQERKSAVP